MQIEENISLAEYTTFGIGGPARWFATVTSEEDVVEAVDWAAAHEVPLFLLGGGSNLLVSDAGFSGLVVRMALKGVEQDGDVFRFAAGECWDDCVGQATAADMAGMECLAGIPGTVGGTPVQNVGAYGQEVASTIEGVRAYDRVARRFVDLSASECGFAYRRSRFNTVDRRRYIVTRVDYRLRKGSAPHIEYADLKARFADAGNQPSLAEVAAAVREIRKSKGMLLVEGDADCRSAGSFFKNPTVSQDVAEKVRASAARNGMALRTFPAGDGHVKISAAWLIEQTGFAKGFRLGAAGVSTKHTLALTNRGGATAGDILALAAKIVDGVEAKFGVHLEMEPEVV